MLKTLLQTWMEAVFSAKKEWISSQAFSANVVRTNLSLTSSGSYVAPSDGLFGFYISDGYSFDIYCQNGKGIIARSAIAGAQTNTFIGSMVIPVAKGSTINYSFSFAPAELWFIPSAGSE